MTANPSAKRIPKVVSFQDPLPQPHRYRPQADRILSGDPAQAAINLFRSADGRFNSGIWEAKPGNGALSSRRASSAISLRVSLSSQATTARSALSELAMLSAGFTGTWEIVEAAKKLYAYYE